MKEQIRKEAIPISSEAWIFSGQGSQFDGMGESLYNRSKLAKQIYNTAEDVLGYSLIRKSREDSALDKTSIVQPLIFTYNYACMVEFGNKFYKRNPQVVAGHSLGEYNALVASGAISFDDCLNLVAKRGQLMQEACEAMPSGNFVLVNAGNKSVAFNSLIDIFKKMGLELGIYNSENQVVFGGEEKLIKEVDEMFQDYEAMDGDNAVFVKSLKTAGAFHTTLMESAVEPFRQVVYETPFVQAEIPIIANTTAELISTPDEIRTELLDHLTKPVLWSQTLRKLGQIGVDETYEYGEKSPLSRMLSGGGRIMAIDNLATRFTPYSRAI